MDHLKAARAPRELRRIAVATCGGAGIGACALTLALDHAFGALAARRVWLDLLAANTPVLRVYERAGFVEEGLFGGAHLLPDGSRAPLRIMSIRRAQWERRERRVPRRGLASRQTPRAEQETHG